MASLVVRLLVLLVPILGIIYPLVRFVPVIYGWSQQRKISRLHEQLRFLEEELQAGAPAQYARHVRNGLNGHATVRNIRRSVRIASNSSIRVTHLGYW